MKFVGTGPTQAPTCGDLGTMAFQNADDVTITGGASYNSSKTAANYYNDTAISDVKPSLLLDFANTEVLDPRVTFTRASTATYYNGKSTAVAEQNLLTYSQDFTQSSWTKSSVVVSANVTTAPDGSITAVSVISTSGSSTATGVYEYSSSYAGTGSTYSIYAKAGTAGFLGISNNSTGGVAWAVFNLNTGVVSSSGSCTASITSVGNGWFRCAAASVSNGGGGFFSLMIKDADPASNPFANGTCASGNYVYLWGAQLEQRSTVTSYTPTTSTAITNYIPVMRTAATNMPRFDHDSRQVLTGTGSVYNGVLTLPTTFSDGSSSSSTTGFYTNQTVTISGTSYTVTAHTSNALTLSGSPINGSQSFTLTNPEFGNSKGLLIEEQRTNLFTYSSDFSNIIWAKINTSIISGATIAPDGTQTAQLVSDNSSGAHIISQSVTTTAQTYTLSVYAKAYQLTSIMLYNYPQSQGIGFDLLTGTTFAVSGISTSTNATITNVGNGWYRCTLTYTGIVNTGVANGIYLLSGNTFGYAGSGRGLYIWGAQLEAGSFATSYIPTSASAVTRSADSASMTGTNFSSWYNQQQSSLYAEFSFASITSAIGMVPVAIDNGVTQGGMFYRGSAGNAAAYSAAGSVTLGSTTVGAFSKMSVGYDATSFSGSLNGAAIVSFNGIYTQLPTQLTIGNARSLWQMTGTIKKIAYYPKVLSSTELQEMTS